MGLRKLNGVKMNKIEKIGVYILTILVFAAIVAATNGVFDDTNYNQYQILNVSNITADTLDTGHGANELYDMDQDVLTTSGVTFQNISIPTTEKFCMNAACTSYIWDNGTGTVIGG